MALMIAHRNNVKLADIRDGSHLPSAVRARHELWIVMRDTMGWSLHEAGEFFGVDHSTICAADKKRKAMVAKRLQGRRRVRRAA
jgi:chromosomal replication initiation ATPase DnaA